MRQRKQRNRGAARICGPLSKSTPSSYRGFETTFETSLTTFEHRRGSRVKTAKQKAWETDEDILADKVPGELRTQKLTIHRRKTAPRRYVAGGAEVNKEIGLWPRSKGSGLSIFGCSRT